jgi:hypothetical protein
MQGYSETNGGRPPHELILVKSRVRKSWIYELKNGWTSSGLLNEIIGRKTLSIYEVVITTSSQSG